MKLAGQAQAACGIGLTHAQNLRFVVPPQAVRRVVPAQVNEGLPVIKDSSPVAAMGLAELALAAQRGRRVFTLSASPMAIAAV